MTQPNDPYSRLFLGIHYRESVETDSGETPQAEIDELSVDRRDGGQETFQRNKKFALPCGHVGVEVTNTCLHNKPCCAQCQCHICKRGVCITCRVIRTNEPLLCILCATQLAKEIQRAQTDAVFIMYLEAIGALEG